MTDEKTLASIRAAIDVSPDNVPLRLALADLLIAALRWEEAEEQFRVALALQPDDAQLKLRLTQCFYEQGKNSEALVLVESMTSGREPHPPALILQARLMLRAGNDQLAIEAYRRAVDLDPDLVDELLAEQLGIARWSSDDDGDFDQRISVSETSFDANPLSFVERPKLTFKDVGGMESLKEEIRLKIIHPLEHPEIYQAYGKKVGGGILMYGPPGCGKTHLARATAGEVDAHFMSIGIHEVLDMWLGNSEKQLHSLFEAARQNSPCVVFFDEVDALGASRGDMKGSGGRQLINQFLAELDGVDAVNDGVLILAATNAPWHLDSAFRRPGRFDRVLFVPPPDPTARGEVLRILLANKPTDNVDFDYLAKKTDTFSGADLKALVDVAIEDKLKDAIQSGVPQPISGKDLAKAVKRVKPSTKEWFNSARNYALYSNQGGAYDDILDYLKLR